MEETILLTSKDPSFSRFLLASFASSALAPADAICLLAIMTITLKENMKKYK